MKKLTAMILTAAMAITAAACTEQNQQTDETTQQEDSQMLGVANPLHDSSKEEIKETDHVDMMVPTEAQDVKWFRLITGDQTIDQADFTYNDMDCTLRTAITQTTDEDISGMYYDWTNDTEDATLRDEEYNHYFWTDNGEGKVEWYEKRDDGTYRTNTISVTSGADQSTLGMLRMMVMITETE